MEKELFKIYLHFYKNTVGERYKPTSKERDIFNDFLTWQKQRLGNLSKNFTFKFLVFQFNYWKTKNIEYGKNYEIIKVFGKKARNTFSAAPIDFNWYMAEMDVGVGRGILAPKIKKTYTSTYGEEYDRRLHLNTDLGLGSCIDNTTLYDRYSESCTKCKFKDICIEIQEKNYPKVAYFRNKCKKNEERKSVM